MPHQVCIPEFPILGDPDRIAVMRAAAEKYRTYEIEEPHFITCEGAVAGSAFLGLSRKQKLIAGTSCGAKTLQRTPCLVPQADNRYRIADGASRVQFAGDVIPVGGRAVGRFFEWMTEMLPRLTMVRDDPASSGKRLVMRPLTASFQQETLDLLGLAPEFRDEDVITADTFRVPSRMTLPRGRGQMSPAIATLTRRFALGYAGASGEPCRRRLFLVPADTTQHVVANDDEVLDFLAPFGFEAVDLGQLSLAEQLCLFADAEYVVAPHSSGLAGLGACVPGTHVIELYSEQRERESAYAALASFAGVDLKTVLCRQKSRGLTDYQVTSIEVDLDLLDDALEDLIDAERAARPRLGLGEAMSADDSEPDAISDFETFVRHSGIRSAGWHEIDESHDRAILRFAQTQERVAALRARKPEYRAALSAFERHLELADPRPLFDMLSSGRKETVYGVKYLDLARHVFLNLEKARALGLMDCPSLRILDLGAGAGHFCFATKLYGHVPVALERPPAGEARSAVSYHAILEFLGIPCSTQRIQPQTALVIDSALRDAFGETLKFDRVTAFAIMFNVNDKIYWRAEDYLFLLDDLRRNLLAPGGLVILKFNTELFGGEGVAMSPEKSAYHHALGELLKPFLVSYDYYNGAVLDLDRPDAWRDAVSVVLPEISRMSFADKVRLTGETSSRRARDAFKRGSRAE